MDVGLPQPEPALDLRGTVALAIRQLRTPATHYRMSREALADRLEAALSADQRKGIAS